MIGAINIGVCFNYVHVAMVEVPVYKANSVCSLCTATVMNWWKPNLAW